jgi:hypothetical protein
MVNGTPAAAIVAVQWGRSDFAVIPIFVSVTPDRTLTRHDGVFCNA